MPRSQQRHQFTAEIPKTSNPASRALASVGIKKLKDFTRFKKTDVAALHGMGPKALGIIQKELIKKKLAFKK